MQLTQQLDGLTVLYGGSFAVKDSVSRYGKVGLSQNLDKNLHKTNHETMCDSEKAVQGPDACQTLCSTHAELLLQ